MTLAPTSPLAGPGPSPNAPDPRAAGEAIDPNALKTRRALAVIAAVAIGTIPTDLAILTYVEPGPWPPVVALRVVTCAILTGLLALIRVRNLGGRNLLRLERATTPLLTALVTSPAIVAGGIGSYYGFLAIAALIARNAMRTDPWRAALPSVALTIVAYPLVLAAASLFSPRIAAQWSDPAAIATLLVHSSYTATVGGFSLWAGHAAYSLQQQLYEARQIGRYKLRTLLGAGGMGEVWSAYFPALKREVAIKILRLPDEAAVARFEREVRATAELAHPNTVRVFDYGRTDDGLWYYAMEKLEGESLAALVRREGPLPPPRVLHLLLQASRAIAEAHEHRIVHRDIKPDNVFVANQGGERDFVKIVDFGIAKAPRAEAGADPATTASIQGTPGYIAPEILRGRAADPRADVYSLGATAYAALTGRPPFAGATVAAILEATLHGRPTPPSELPALSIPGDLEAVVLQCLDPDPESRYASGAKLAAALGACAGAGAWNQLDAPAGPKGEPSAREKRPGLADAPTLASDAPEAAVAPERDP